MTIRKTSLLSVGAFALASLIASSALADSTEDILYMSDGRIMHGQILEETDTTIVFEYTHVSLGITTKLTIQKDNISKIEMDVSTDAPDSDPAAGNEDGEFDFDEPREQMDVTFFEELKNTYGAYLAKNDSSLLSVYVIPMRGQMGTDIHLEFYEGLREEIRELKPDLLVFELDCSDVTDHLLMIKDELANLGELEEEEEEGIVDLDQYRDLVNMFHDEFRDISQVMWVKDSVGISSVMALAWKEFYMHPDARLDGISQIYLRVASISDSQVRAKMVAAWTAMAKAFLEYGQHPLAIAEAMMIPERTLGASWKGRQVIWTLDGQGQYIVDGNDKDTTRFTAKTAEDFCLTDGTAETLDDLMLLRGYREYYLVQGQAEPKFNKYVKSWRRTLKSAINSLKDYSKHLSWATGEDTLKYLGRAKGDMERVLASIKRYDAVRVRLEQLGISALGMQVTIERLKERIRALRDRDRDGGGPGRGGGKGSPGGG